MIADVATASATLFAALGRRPALDTLAREAWRLIVAEADQDAAERWADAVLSLLQANAGATCLSTLLRLRGAPDRLAVAAMAATEICRHAGSSQSIACMTLWDRLRADGLWPGLVLLAVQAPDCLPVAIAHAAAVIEAVGDAGYAGFVALGLKASGRDRAKRAAFFALASPTARQALARGDVHGFAAQERRLKLFVTALWGRVPTLLPLPLAPGGARPRRVRVSDGVMLFPESFPGVPPPAQATLYRASAAHALAHVMAAAPRQRIGTLKPMQMALIGLVEDARVEALALRAFPGLRRLWAPYHVARPEGGTATALFARLARALFDPSWTDGDGFIAKARALFAAADLRDPGMSRRIGGLLGNDLGQARVQFNDRTYVIEPPYRDDGLGLWAYDLPPDAALDSLEIMVEAARPRESSGEGQTTSPATEPAAARARPAAAPDNDGQVLARYPEWDATHGVERPDWTMVREVAPALGDTRRLAASLDAHPDLRHRVDRLVRAARPGRPKRLKRQPDGIDLDMDAVLDAEIDRRSGQMPSGLVYRHTSLRVRDLATVILVDVSESTRLGGVLDTERLAVALLAEAMQHLGDPFALLAFASDGREHVRLTRIKDFREPFAEASRARLAGLSPGFSTRLGAALRHTGAEIARVRSYRRLVLVLTDGEPSDIDVADPRDLVEDSRRAVLGLRVRGIDTFGVVFGTQGLETAARIFGRAGYLALRRLEDLPARLSDLYFRLSHR